MPNADKTTTPRIGRRVILDFIANNQHRGINRAQVVAAIEDQVSIGDRRASVSKILGRLVQGGWLCENLTMRVGSGLPGVANRACILVQMDLESLRDEQLPEQPFRIRTHAEQLSQSTSSPEKLIQYIAHQTAVWNSSGQEEQPARRVVLFDATFTADLEVFLHVSYENEQHLMSFEREVVQMAPHVKHTQSKLMVNTTVTC